MAKKKIGLRHAAGLSQGHANKAQSTDKELYEAMRDELDGLRATVTALLQKMDADFADVTNASVDYEATVTLADTTFEK